MRLTDLIVDDVSAEQSLVGRYHRALRICDLGTEMTNEEVSRVSLREGARVIPAGKVAGVEILVCDETSLMETRTYKDLDACVTMARVKAVGYRDIVLSSGGNLNYSMARYAKQAEVCTYLFNPTTTLYKADGSNFGAGSHLIAVDRPEPEVKKLAERFAHSYALLLVPDIRWRLAASAMRAAFIAEQMEQLGPITWITQAMCAGYGPAGIYNGFSSLVRERAIPRERIPKFLGYQQEANAPMVHAWKARELEISTDHVHPEPGRYIEPGLYNTNPGPNYTRLVNLMTFFGGDMTEVSAEDYQRYGREVLALLESVGISLERLPSGEIREKTPILTGVGLLKAIHELKLIKPGERVLFLVTGGAPREGEKTPATPTVVVDESMSIQDWVEELGDRFGLQQPTYLRRYDQLFTDSIDDFIK